MAPILEDGPVDGQRLVQVPRRVPGDPGPKHVVMRPLDHRDRVDLHVPQVLDRLGCSLFAGPDPRPAVQQQGMQRQPPRCLQRNRLVHDQAILPEKSIAQQEIEYGAMIRSGRSLWTAVEKENKKGL